jgi:hypothetical protein
MVEESSGKAALTWKEITDSQRDITEDWEKMKQYREKMGIHIH